MAIDDVTQRLYAGDGCFVLQGLLHGIVCIEPGILADMFSLYKEDFL